MPRKRYKAEEIVAKLRQVDVLVSQGQNIGDAIRQIGVSEVTYSRMLCREAMPHRLVLTGLGCRGAAPTPCARARVSS
jgi:predicted RNase H-like nuclease